tara:strand:+ start:45 stop:530 length:486 start_codon:yes stop_codon:yes gene_type:complete
MTTHTGEEHKQKMWCEKIPDFNKNIDDVIDDYEDDTKSPWAKTLIKHCMDLEFEGINARAVLRDLYKNGRGYEKKLKKRDLLMVIYLADLKEHFKQIWSYRLHKYLHNNPDMMKPNRQFADYENWSWFWENMNLVFENVFMNKIMEHITRSIQNPDYWKLL